MRSHPLLWRTARIAAIFLLGMIVLLPMPFFVGHGLIYHPHPYPANYRRLFPAGMLELQFSSRAGRQTAFYLPARNGQSLPDRIWVAFCGNGSLALDWLPLITHNENAGDAFLLIDYPGYGRSEGWASIANTRSAADDAVAALTRRLGVSETALEPRLATIGHSLGAAAALDFAARHQRVRLTILLAPFTSLHEEAAIFIGAPLSRLFPDNYDNRAALHEIAQRQPPPRIAIFHGSEDHLIPPWMGRELAAEFSGFVTFRGVPAANHDTVIATAQDEILAMMRQAQVERPAP